MKKSVSVSTLLISLLLAVLITSQLTVLFMTLSSRNARYSSVDGNVNAIAAVSELDDLVRSDYVGEIDEENLKNTLLQAYITALGDKYGQVMNAVEWSDLSDELSGTGDGIGVYVTFTQDSDVLTILSVFHESPAEKAGIHAGDGIFAVDGKPISEMTYNEIISDLKGEAGTTVNVEVVRDGEHLTFSVERGAYQIQTVDYRTYEYQNKKVGIIRLEEFETATVSQFQSAVDDLTGQGVSALVIDLRDNPGGELTSVIDISDYLLPDGGPIVHIRDKNDEKTTYDADDGHSVDLPIAVLMNENTASAAELFSSALRDYQKAILVGETSYGKGCVQSLISMTSGDVLRLTVAFYDPPYSENFDEIGLTPDVEVKDPDGGFACFYQLQTEDDTVMMTAIQSLFTDK